MIESNRSEFLWQLMHYCPYITTVFAARALRVGGWVVPRRPQVHVSIERTFLTSLIREVGRRGAAVSLANDLSFEGTATTCHKERHTSAMRLVTYFPMMR